MIAKKILFVFLSVTLMFLSYRLITIVLLFSPTNSMSLIFIISLGIDASITGIFAFPGFVFATNKLLSSNYYIISNPKLLIKVYNLLGISFFRRALLFFFWGIKKNKVKYFNGTKGGLKNFIYQSKQSEFGHLASLVLIFPVSFIFIIKGHLYYAITTSIINIIGNLYPLILQRYHRSRIERILNATKTRES